MSSDFDPSPRASKRRRTRYGSQRTTLDDDATVRETPDVQLVPEGDETAPTDGHTTLEGGLNTHADKHGLETKTRISSKTSAPPRSKPAPKSKDRSGDTEVSGDAEISEAPETPSRVARKPKPSTSRKDGINIDFAENGVDGHPDGKADEPAGEGDSENKGDTTSQPRSSGRQRRPPQRLADKLADSAEPAPTKRVRASVVQSTPDERALASPALKGILAPSKTQRMGPRKSVMFDHDEKEIEEQFGFRDIDSPARPQPKTTARKATPYPKRSKVVGVSEAESSETIWDKHSIPDADNDVFDDMLIDEPIVEVPLPDTPQEVSVSITSANLLEDNPQLRNIKSTVLARLTSISPPSKAPGHLEKQYSELWTLLRSTIASSESNSLLLLGPRGAGKSMLLDLALRDLETAHPNDFHTVRLNGFLQTDDRLALREIWRQLGHSRDLDESETEDIGASYADTMASLLSLLSHPDEIAMDPQSNGDVEALAQDASVIAGGGQKTSKAIVFILDEFDLFTTHPRQTLLYNLFDIAQSKKAPIAVIGCSTRMDVIECLEKRVKSRFSHRWLLVPSVKSLAEWNQCVVDALLIDLSEEAQAKRSKEEEKWVERWNSEMKETFIPSNEIQSLVKTQFYTTKSLPDLFTALFPSLAALQIPSPSSSPSSSKTSLKSKTTIPHIAAQPTILSTLPDLPLLHLSLLLATTRLETIHHLSTTNLNLVHAHYTELIASTKLRQSTHGSIASSGSLRQWSRELCRGAWEQLGIAGVIVPVAGSKNEEGASGAQEEETRMWRCEVGLEDVEWAVRVKFGMNGVDKVGGAGEVLLRWCREV